MTVSIFKPRCLSASGGSKKARPHRWLCIRQHQYRKHDQLHTRPHTQASTMSMAPIWAVSGFGIHEDVAAQFSDFKLKREPHNYRYLIYKIVDNKDIVIESTGAASETYEDFTSKLMQVTSECRYGVVDMDLTSKDGRPTSKLFFMAWSPSTAHVKSKMVYASARDDVKRAMKGVGIYLTATDADELSREWVEDSLAKYL